VHLEASSVLANIAACIRVHVAVFSTCDLLVLYTVHFNSVVQVLVVHQAADKGLGAIVFLYQLVYLTCMCSMTTGTMIYVQMLLSMSLHDAASVLISPARSLIEHSWLNHQRTWSSQMDLGSQRNTIPSASDVEHFNVYIYLRILHFTPFHSVASPNARVVTSNSICHDIDAYQAKLCNILQSHPTSAPQNHPNPQDHPSH
jgi:hypothetical protein